MTTSSMYRAALLLAMAAGFAVIATFAVMIATGRSPDSAEKEGQEPCTWYVVVYRSAPGAAMADPDCIGRHIAFMNGLKKKGQVLLAGRFTDAEGGLAIFRFPDRDTAIRTITADPILVHDVLRADIRAWRPVPVSRLFPIPSEMSSFTVGTGDTS